MGKEVQRQPMKKLFIGAVVVVATILGLMLLHFFQIRNDANRFAEADKNVQAVFDGLVASVGAPIQIEDNNECYNTEQGPYDDGYLWCQVASAAYFSIESPPSVDGYFSQLIEANNFQRTGDLEFKGSSGLQCGVTFDTTQFAGKPAYGFPINLDAKQVLIVRCAGRAKAKHYTYLNWD